MNCDAPKEKNGTILTDANGQQYFVYGNYRIKITEHFSDSGKSIADLIADLIEIESNNLLKKTA